jgi:hypothetical protein
LKLRLSIAVGALSLAASAATSTVWEVNGFSDFLKGRLINLSLTADGILQPGPAVRWSTPLNQPALWSLAAAPDGSLFAATGHSGKVYRIAADGKSSLAWSAPQSEVFALACDAKGILFAGSSPNGSVYRMEGADVRELWRSPAKYIWAIQAAPDGSLFIATGEPGRIYHLAAGASTAELYYETGQANVTSLALGPNGSLLAGTDPNGLLYEISSPGKATVLYDSSLPEIRAIATDAKGFIYVAAMGGALSTRTGTGPTASQSTTAVVATSPTVITVSEAKENAVNADNDQSGVKVSGDASKASAAAQASTSTTAAVTEVSGVEKSAIYRISPERSVETLRTSKEENVYDLLLDGGDLLFSTDQQGRIYRWHDRQTTLIAEPGNGETTRLVQSHGSLFAAMSNPARLFSFGATASAPASYESQVHDSISVARWGHLQWHGSGTGLALRTRTGNTARPDATWSPWSDPMSDPANSLLKSPPARFVQWRAEWSASASAALSTVDIPYLPQNGPPAVRSITVTSVLSSNPLKSGTTANTNSSAAYSVTVTDTGEAPAASSASSATQSVSRLQTTQTQVSWQADDPDSDRLVYSLYFRAEDETTWHLIRSRMFENSLLLDADVFADGRYYFKVVASDSPANAAEYARQAEITSSPVLIDNTPPLVTIENVRRDANLLDADIDGNDKTSPLRLCEYSIDAGFWLPVEAVDGVTDSPRERFHLHLDNLHSGEHLLVVRIYDTANNAGLARTTLK